MIFKEFYSNLDEIELEHRPGVEALISNEIPSLSWLSSRDEGLRVGYYLFFTNDKSSPIGLVRFEEKDFENSPRPKNFIQRMLATPEKTSWLNIIAPGSKGLGFFCEAGLEDLMADEIKKLISEKLNETYHLIQLNLNSNFALDFSYKVEQIQWSKPEILFKNKNSFEEYLNSRSVELQDKLNNLQSQFEEDELAPEFCFIKSYDELKEKCYGPETSECFGSKLPRKQYDFKDNRYFALFLGGELLNLYVLSHSKQQAFIEYHGQFSSKSGYELLSLISVIKYAYQIESIKKVKIIKSVHWPRKILDSLIQFGFSSYKGKTFIISNNKKPLKKRRRLSANK